MTYDGQVKRKSLRQSFRTSAIVLCFLASCAVYDAPPSQGSADASNGGSSGSSDIARGGSEVDAAGRGGTTPTAAAGTLGDVGPGGADTGSSGAAGSPDGGAADAGGGGKVSGGSSNHGGAAGSANGGRGGTAAGGTGGSAGNGGLGGNAGKGGLGGSAGNGGTGGNAATITDLTPKQPATASSEQSGHAPASGNDGDGATRWCASSGAFPQWWRVDLGATHALKDYRISFEYPDRKYYFDVETSTDDAVYTRQVRTSGSAALQSGSFPAGVSARYVRLTITSADAGATPTWASFFEFVVTGT